VTLLDALAAAVGPEHVVTDRSVLASYETDWTGRFTGRALAAVRPRDTAQVAGVVTACADAEVPLCIQGGNTGLVGGSIPVDGAVLLSLARLDEIGEVDPVAAQVTVGAGVTLARLQQQVRPLGLDFGVDFAARESCTIGGMAATNAGGERVLRYGTMRAQVLGLEAVLADGTVVSRLGGLPKDNTGYDVVSLMVGAEGTLGALTRLRLRLVPLLNGRAVALIAVDDTEAAVRLVRQARDELASLEAAELIFADGVELVRRHTGLPAPFADAHPAYLLLECTHRDDPSDELLALLEASTDVRDATVATDARGRYALWQYREAHTECINAEGVPVKLDVAVPLRSLANFVAQLPAALPAGRLILFGHVNEGNLHVNVLDAREHADAVTDAVLRLVASYGGSISAEHGVGRAKQPWLGLSRSTEEIAMMRTLKTALDPRGLLNPGVLLPPA
jgi:FAD/FMN-containing dehydrogenase